MMVSQNAKTSAFSKLTKSRCSRTAASVPPEALPGKLVSRLKANYTDLQIGFLTSASGFQRQAEIAHLSVVLLDRQFCWSFRSRHAECLFD